MKILTGTASWTDPTLIKCKRFYPAGCTTPEARLRYYASQFPLVEVDSSYYSLPTPSNSVLWAERTPADFVFNVKAFSLFTGHAAQRKRFSADLQAALPQNGKANVYYKDLPGELRDEIWRRYLHAIKPLAEAGKLGAVHFQFAPWLTSSPENRTHIEHCAERMAGYTVAVEFRNASWFDERHTASTLAFEREHGFVNVVVDEPNTTANSIPSIWEVTNDRLAVVRLHGRNHETWNVKGTTAASDRFNYDYSDDELAGLAAQIRSLAALVAQVHVVLNNNFEDQGQRNARTLMEMLS
ncbi:DUF72 domain-containing protein [Paraburkholderia fungorum]|uniref:DUF72 domain-containing protein n=1 Tax=Paraburkholderia fungorum TaxID=134537 RepID=UPI0016188C5A|nr:DUF72 domain-containing protein [Paraburkholderia fungorum]MBB5547799.1 uncharacterized protein YecE (DUF72 family) [Paraburkholderia fungorum]